MYKEGHLGKCTIPEFYGAETIERSDNDAKSATEYLTHLTVLQHYTHTNTLSFS